VPEPAVPAGILPKRRPGPGLDQPPHQVTPAFPVLPLPRRAAEDDPAPVAAPRMTDPPLAAAQRQPAAPAMNDRVAGRIAEMLRREGQRESHGVS
jgi:hypothetical protein